MRVTPFAVGTLALAAWTAACGDAGTGQPTEADETPNGASGANTAGTNVAAGASGNGASGTPSSGGSGGSAQGGGSGRGGNGQGGGATAGAAGMAGSGDSGAPGGACSPKASGDGGAKGKVGVWEDVTPADANVASTGNGAEMVLVDPARPSDIYVGINTRGVWKSTDYGATWHKANTGTNGEKVATGGFPYGAISLDPCRNPSTPPSIYVTQLFGSGGYWKSGDGGASWKNVWDKNIYGTDGVTNISSDVGGDVHSIHVVTPSEPDHLIAALHGYSGSGGNNGVFETTDGGGKWTVHTSATFSFQPHNDVLFPLSATTWMVTPGTVSSRLNMFRSADAAKNWKDLGEAPARAIGRSFTRAGSTIYAGTDYNSNVVKSTDEGTTWTKLPNSGGQISWVVASATKVYASGGYSVHPTIRHAELSNDATWVTDLPSDGKSANANGHDAKITFDGTHYVIIAAQHVGGVWRYIEP